ncbi:MAG: hypothetical protein HYT66_01395 [Candidatus Yanofskybacteria bacterium]|nr:hypothetical protein [Candidatus Yanofskybacteria bacterium]
MKKEEKVSPWPFWGAAVLFAANVDLILIPYVLKPRGLSFWTMYWVAMPIANLEIFGWFYFWRWFAWKWLPSTEPVKDTVELTKSVIELLNEYGLLGTIIYKIRKTFGWATNPGRKRSLEKWGHFWMLFLGAEPFFAGGRLLGVVSCGATRWKAGLISLCVGNTAHVYISIKTWDLIFYLWDKYKGWVILFGIIALLFMARGYIWKRLKKEQTLEKGS